MKKHHMEARPGMTPKQIQKELDWRGVVRGKVKSGAVWMETSAFGLCRTLV
ncbi:MAG: hypothetical protein ACLSB9_38685 [Hydrogeniiclostridium mannosilyticum]